MKAQVFLKRRSTLSALIFWLSVAGVRVTRGDEPPPLPETRTFCSNNGLYCAITTPEEHRTQVYRVEPDGKRSGLWSLPEYLAIAYLADDGEHLVAGHPDNNLLKLGTPGSAVMLRFFQRDHLIGTVSLQQLVGDPAKLPRTVSHVEWGTHLGFDQAGHYQVVTFDQRRLSFVVQTGKPVGAEVKSVAPIVTPSRPAAATKAAPSRSGGCS